MAININHARDAAHHLICGATGSGKSSYLRSAGSPLKKYEYLIYWDPDEDYRVNKAMRMRSLSAFAAQLQKAIASEKPYSIALTVDSSEKNFEAFAAIVWAAIDGNRDTAIVAEELANSVKAGHCGDNWKKVMTRARKYGGDVFAITQRPAIIDKTTFSSCTYIWCGYLDKDVDIKRMGEVVNKSADEIRSLEKLEYWYKTPESREPIKGKVKIPRKRS